MVNSKVEIWNMCLSRLGVSQEIEDPEDTDEPALLANRWYDHCRDELIQSFPWPFSMRAIQLAESANETFPGWGAVYAYNSDFLFLRYVTDESGVRTIQNFLLQSPYQTVPLAVPVAPFQIAAHSDLKSKIILTDMENAFALYSARITNVTMFDPLFISVLASRMAMELGPGLGRRKETIARAAKEFIHWQGMAQAMALNEHRPDRRPESPSIQARI